jgi:hypothetical protein
MMKCPYYPFNLFSSYYFFLFFLTNPFLPVLIFLILSRHAATHQLYPRTPTAGGSRAQGRRWKGATIAEAMAERGVRVVATPPPPLCSAGPHALHDESGYWCIRLFIQLHLDWTHHLLSELSP